MAGKGSWMVVWNLKVAPVEAMLSMIILMMPKTQVKNQESNKFQESKSRSIKASFKNQRVVQTKQVSRIKESFNQDSRLK